MTGSSMIAETEFVVPKPPSLSFEESATLLVTFLTAHYALNHVAGLRKGERVLIHHATGGVGLAAIQIVRAGRSLLNETVVHPSEDLAAGVDDGEAVAGAVHQRQEELILRR